MSRYDITLKVSNLCKEYGKRKILKNLTFEVGRGEIIGFLGLNGAGKSTTIKIIAGLVAPTSGTIEINGIEISDGGSQTSEALGIMFEAPAFYNYLSAYKNLEILNKLSKKKTEDIDDVLKIVGLSEFARLKVEKYSQGMRQRLGIAQAILSRPDILILDEPTNGLDPFGIKEMKDLIKRLAKEEHNTVFLSSHLLSEVEQLCDRVIIINEGEIITSKRIVDLQNENVTSLEQYFLSLMQEGEKIA